MALSIPCSDSRGLCVWTKCAGGLEALAHKITHTSLAKFATVF